MKACVVSSHGLSHASQDKETLEFSLHEQNSVLNTCTVYIFS